MMTSWWFHQPICKNLLVKLDHFSRDRDENKKSLKPPPVDENPSSWDPTLIPRTSPSTWWLVLSDSGRKNKPTKTVTVPQNGWTYCQQIFGRCLEAKDVFLRFLGVFLNWIYISIALSVNTIMRAILYLNLISGGIPNCEVAPMLPVTAATLV